MSCCVLVRVNGKAQFLDLHCTHAADSTENYLRQPPPSPSTMQRSLALQK